MNTLNATILAEIKGIKSEPNPFVNCIVQGIGIILNGKTTKTW